LFSVNTLFFLIGFFHGLVILYFLTGLLKKSNGRVNKEKFRVSVIIAARNESENISNCIKSILSQSYPHHLFEVIVINDRSTDETANIVESISKEDSRVTLFNVENGPVGIHPKKHALSLGVEKATGEIIFETDADVTVGNYWIESTVERFTSDVGLVVGRSSISKNSGSALENFQAVDFLLLMASAQGSLGHGIPMGGTGQNLAYRKSVFEEVGGLKVDTHRYVSNDILFINKVSKTKWKILGNLNPNSAVSTIAVNGWQQFISQRTRWASNAYWKELNSLLLLILGVNYIVNLFVGAGIIFMAITRTYSFPVIALTVYKFLTEMVFYRIASSKLDRKFLSGSFIRWFIWVTPYVLFIGILGGLGIFNWKGDKVKSI